MIRRRPSWVRERDAWKKGAVLAGVDEVGTGALAGPVFAGAVIFPKYLRVPNLMDSKLLRPGEREEAAVFLRERTVWAVGCAEVEEIEGLGLRPATFLAMRRALQALSVPPTALIVDAFRIPEIAVYQECFFRADRRFASVAAASIIAKVQRDRVMSEYDGIFPGYGFASHKGYGTAEHLLALRRLGPSPLHRMNYAPIRRLLQSGSVEPK